MRKKKWAEPYLSENSEFVVAQPENFQGKWNDILKREQLHVEIGCGKGDYFIGMSKLFPETAWIALEKDLNVAAVAAKKAIDAGCEKNCRLICQDAESIEQWFKSGEIDILHLNFSDPWPKNGYRKRRLSHQSFLDKYKKLLKPSGKVVLKTDNSKLFEFSLIEFTKCNWEIEEVWVNFRSEEHAEDVITEYERRFMDLGQPIYRAIFISK